MTRQQWAVAIVLRGFGILDLLALVAVFLPRSAMVWACVRLGLSEMPAAPIVGYLARSTSLMYALHGSALLFASFDVPRYWRLIRLFSWLAVGHGALLLGIGFSEGMPSWWQCVEGPCFSLTGVVVLLLQWRADRASTVEASDSADRRALTNSPGAATGPER